MTLIPFPQRPITLPSRLFTITDDPRDSLATVPSTLMVINAPASPTLPSSSLYCMTLGSLAIRISIVISRPIAP